MHNDKEIHFELISMEEAEEIAENNARKNWLDRPYQHNVLYVEVDYEEEDIVCCKEDMDLIKDEIKETGIPFKLYLFKGFRDKERATETLKGEQYLLYNSELDTYTISYK